MGSDSAAAAYRRFMAAKATPMIEPRDPGEFVCQRCGRAEILVAFSAYGQLCFGCTEAAFEATRQGGVDGGV